MSENSFDLIVAYSVFSHLSEIAANEWVRQFSKLLRPGGIAAFTTRPRSYIGVKPFSLGAKMSDAELLGLYDQGGFPFVPVSAGALLDPKYYGEASISPSYAIKKWGDILKLRAFDDTNWQPIIVLEKA